MMGKNRIKGINNSKRLQFQKKKKKLACQIKIHKLKGINFKITRAPESYHRFFTFKNVIYIQTGVKVRHIVVLDGG